MLGAWGSAAPAPRAAAGLTTDQAATLASLRQVDDQLFTMTFQGGYDAVHPVAAAALDPRVAPGGPAWACSLFVTPGGGDLLYGRNFDWQPNPALLLFTRPPNGPATVSMVDVSYLGIDGGGAGRLLADRALQQKLLRAPLLPFDGMNQYGLTIGMADIPDAKAPNDPARETVGSVRIMRLVLDGARTIDEGVAIMRRYNIDFTGGPSLHYLLADASGRSAVVEPVGGRLNVVPNDRPWQGEVNFVLTGASERDKQADGRYRQIAATLDGAGARLSPGDAMRLLQRVAQPHTRWSVVYGMHSGQVELVRDQHYDRVHSYSLALAQR
jgi:hypothetical protein